MAVHIETGKKGEDIATDWLTQEGFAILCRNWRIGKLEIDVIAIKEDFIHFIEVKTRSHHKCGEPELFVNRKKFICLQKAAQAFLTIHKKYKWVQYDVMAITLIPQQAPLVELFWDVYY